MKPISSRNAYFRNLCMGLATATLAALVGCSSIGKRRHKMVSGSVESVLENQTFSRTGPKNEQRKNEESERSQPTPNLPSVVFVDFYQTLSREMAALIQLCHQYSMWSSTTNVSPSHINGAIVGTQDTAAERANLQRFASHPSGSVETQGGTNARYITFPILHMGQVDITKVAELPKAPPMGSKTRGVIVMFAKMLWDFFNEVMVNRKNDVFYFINAPESMAPAFMDMPEFGNFMCVLPFDMRNILSHGMIITKLNKILFSLPTAVSAMHKGCKCFMPFQILAYDQNRLEHLTFKPDRDRIGYEEIELNEHIKEGDDWQTLEKILRAAKRTFNLDQNLKLIMGRFYMESHNQILCSDYDFPRDDEDKSYYETFSKDFCLEGETLLTFEGIYAESDHGIHFYNLLKARLKFLKTTQGGSDELLKGDELTVGWVKMQYDVTASHRPQVRHNLRDCLSEGFESCPEYMTE